MVVIDAPVGGTDPFWVNDMCDALGATALWAVVDATRKTADTARHLRNLGDVEALVGARRVAFVVLLEVGGEDGIGAVALAEGLS